MSELPGPAADVRRKRRRRIVFAAILLLLGVSGYAGASIAIQLSSKALPGNAFHLPGPLKRLPYLAAPAPKAGHRINILVMGIDQRPHQPANPSTPFTPSASDPGNTDTMAVVSIDPASKSATILSIPRDLWLEIPDGRGGWTLNRINAAFPTGVADNLPGGGPASAEAAVTYNFGIPITYYVVIDFKGFMKLIDALGGIDLTVPTTITSTVLPEADTGGYEFTFFAGREHLDGELALAYARFRNDPQGDLGRIQRQQQVALAARQKALSLGWLGHALQLWSRYNTAVQTNIPGWQIPGMALLAKQIESLGIKTRSLGEPGATSEVILPSGADVLFPDPSIAARIVGDALDNTTLRDETYARLTRIYPPPGAPTAAVLGGMPPQSGTPSPDAPVERSPYRPDTSRSSSGGSVLAPTP